MPPHGVISPTLGMWPAPAACGPSRIESQGNPFPVRHRPAPHPFARSALFRQSCVGSTPRGQAFGTKLWCQCEFLAPGSGAKGTRWRQALALPPLHVGPCRSTDPHASPCLSRKHPCGVWGGTPVDTLKAIASPLMGNGSELGSKFHYVHGKVLPGRVGFSGD